MADTRKYGSLVTDAGNALIMASMMEEAQTVNLTTIACGDGGGSYYRPTTDMTELKNQTWEGDIKSVQVSEESSNLLIVTGVLPADVGGFTVREMAVKTDDGVMFAICNTPDIEKVVITSGVAGEVELIIRVMLSNEQIENITFIVDPNVVTATKKNIEEHNESASAHEALFNRKANNSAVNAHINDVDVHVNPVTMGNYDTAISGLIEHTENANIHTTAADKAKWDKAATDATSALSAAAEALNKAAELESRVTRVEDGVFNNITGNPFMISFESLDGITLTKGVWNKERNRIEC